MAANEYTGGIEDVFYSSLLGVILALLLTTGKPVAIDSYLLFLAWLSVVILLFRLGFSARSLGARWSMLAVGLLCSWLVLNVAGLARYVSSRPDGDAVAWSFLITILLWFLTGEFCRWEGGRH